MKRLLPLVALLGAAALPAQKPLVSRTLDSGTVVRLLLWGDSTFQGVLLTPLTPDAQRVVFSPTAQEECSVPQVVCRVEVPVGDVQAIEFRQGSRAGRGAVIGTLLGVVAGFMAGRQVVAECRAIADGSCSGAASVIGPTTLIGGAFGAGIGALIGRASPAWEPAP